MEGEKQKAGASGISDISDDASGSSCPAGANGQSLKRARGGPVKGGVRALRRECAHWQSRRD